MSESRVKKLKAAVYGGTGYASALGQGIEDERGRGGGLVTCGLRPTTLDHALTGSYKHTTDGRKKHVLPFT